MIHEKLQKIHESSFFLDLLQEWRETKETWIFLPEKQMFF